MPEKSFDSTDLDLHMKKLQFQAFDVGRAPPEEGVISNKYAWDKNPRQATEYYGAKLTKVPTPFRTDTATGNTTYGKVREAGLNIPGSQSAKSKTCGAPEPDLVSPALRDAESRDDTATFGSGTLADYTVAEYTVGTSGEDWAEDWVTRPVPGEWDPFAFLFCCLRRCGC